MKKLTLYIILCSISIVSNINAKTNTITNINEAKSSLKQATPILEKTSFEKNLKNLNSNEERNEFIKNRTANFTISKRSAISNIGGGAFSAIDPISKRLLKEREKIKNRSIFDDIFDKAVSRAEKDKYEKNSNFIPAITEEMLIKDTKKVQKNNLRNLNVPKISTIKITLPGSNNIVDIPTDEHIPYFNSNINVRKDGRIEVTETIIAVANGKKIKDKFIRVFPEFSLDRNQNKHPYDIQVLSTKINDIPIENKLTKDNEYQYLEISNGRNITPGVYKFTISYLVNRHIAFYDKSDESDEFDEFAWNVTGNNWNMVINRASASLSLPNKSEALGVQAASIRYDKILEDVIIKRSSDNDYLFALSNPLSIAQGFKIIASIEKGIINEPDISENIGYLITDNITFIISFLTLLFIVIAMTKTQHIISKNNKEKGNFANPRINNKISTSEARYILTKKIDKKSLISVLVNLIYNKNKISIEKDGKKIILIKKTDSVKNLNTVEKLVFKTIFNRENTEFIIAKNNSLKLKRLFEKLKTLTVKKYNYKTFLKIIGYWAIALSMILISIFTNLFINDGAIKTAFIASYSVITLFISSYILYNKFNFIKSKNIKNIIINIISIFFIITSIILLIGSLNFAISLNITLAVITITYYTKMFTKDNYIGYHLIREVRNYNIYVEKVLNGKIKNVEKKKLYGYVYSFDLDTAISEDEKIIGNYISKII
jgi:hypothetical protein